MSGPLYSGTSQTAVTVDMPLTHGSFNGLMNGEVTTRIRSTAIYEQKLSRGSCWRNSASKLPSVLTRKQILGITAVKRTGNRWYGYTWRTDRWEWRWGQQTSKPSPKFYRLSSGCRA